MYIRLFLFLAVILSGFALINIPLTGTFLASLYPVVKIIGVVAILLFSLVLIYLGVKFLVNKK